MPHFPLLIFCGTGHFLACQSLDNTIRVFATKDRFKQLHKKVFKGETMQNSEHQKHRVTHLPPNWCQPVLVCYSTTAGHMVAGYACQIAFSANGRFMVSGDGEGKVFCWDWKNTRLLKKFKAHDNGPTIGSIWHPIEPSWLATCGWDGMIKLWH